MNRVLIIANTYYQLILAIQMSKTIKKNDKIIMLLSDHSKGSDEICRRLNVLKVFDKTYYIKSKEVIYSKRTELKRLKNYIDLTFRHRNRWSFFLDEVLTDTETNCFDEIICFNFGTDTYGLFSILSEYNHELRISQYEEGILSYGYIPELTFGRRIINFTRKLLRKPIVSDAMGNFYCYHPSCYNGPLNPVKVPAISNDSSVVEILRNVFQVDGFSLRYDKKYIFFTSVYDFEGGEAIGEYDVVKKVANLVGKDNLLVKTHPRDMRTIYSDEEFNVDKNSAIPWEVIQLSENFGENVFLTATSGSVLAGSFMSEEPVRTLFLYKLCDVSRNASAKKSADDIKALLSKQDYKHILRNVSIADKVEDILS